MEQLDRIVVDPQILLGQPVVRGSRLPVYAIVEAIAAGDTRADLLAAYPFLTQEDIEQALHFASRMTRLTLEVA
jgi:uncharacterized protein (DUF433 family)